MFFMVDKVRPLKYESPDTGGTEYDMFPSTADPTEDYLSALGIAFGDQDDIRIFRDGNDLKFEDVTTGEINPLSRFLTGTELAEAGRYAIPLNHNGTISDGTWLGYTSLIPGDATPIVVPRNSTLKDFTFSNDSSSADYRLEFRKNATTNAIFYNTGNLTNQKIFTATDINESFSAGDTLFIQYIDLGTNASDAALILFFQNV